MKHIVVTLFISSSLLALSLSECIERSMQNNPSLKEKKLLIQSAKEITNVTYAGYKPKLDLFYSYSESTEKNFVGSTSASSAEASLSYNLFNGFADLLMIKSAQEDEKTSIYTHRVYQADLKLDVTRAYINYLQSIEELKVAKANLTSLAQQLHDAKNFFEQGLFAKNDYLQVDVERLKAEQSVLKAQSKKRLSFYRLKHLLGGMLEHHEQPEDIALKQSRFNEQDLTSDMLSNRSELKLLDAQAKSVFFQYRAYDISYLPNVDLEVKYQVAGVDPIPNGGQTFQTHDQSTLVLTMNWNLYNGGADKANRAALFSKKSALDERIKALGLELDYQLKEALENYKLAQKSMQVTQHSLTQAQENFRITNNQYQVNIASTSLMLDAQYLLKEAQSNYSTAQFSYLTSIAVLERIIEKELLTP